jgi:hypothetical protein
MPVLGSPFGIISRNAQDMAKKHKFLLYAMEFLAYPKSVSIPLKQKGPDRSGPFCF